MSKSLAFSTIKRAEKNITQWSEFVRLTRTRMPLKGQLCWQGGVTFTGDLIAVSSFDLDPTGQVIKIILKTGGGCLETVTVANFESFTISNN